MTEKPARILIVDDEFSVRDSLYHWFQKEGYEVTAVAGAAEAFRPLRSTAMTWPFWTSSWAAWTVWNFKSTSIASLPRPP